jgi:hypothetical protein
VQDVGTIYSRDSGVQTDAFLKARTRGPQMAMLEKAVGPLDRVNLIQERFKAWREQDYPGIPPPSPANSW